MLVSTTDSLKHGMALPIHCAVNQQLVDETRKPTKDGSRYARNCSRLKGRGGLRVSYYSHFSSELLLMYKSSYPFILVERSCHRQARG